MATTPMPQKTNSRPVLARVHTEVAERMREKGVELNFPVPFCTAAEREPENMCGAHQLEHPRSAAFVALGSV